jgi:hypothetical protein
MRIEIRNWDAFNARKDVKAPSWFRLSHNLFEDHEFFDFSHTEIVAWIYILSLASKKSSAVITVNQPHLERVGRIKWKDFHTAVQKLQFIQCINVELDGSLRGRNADDTPAASTLHNTTLQNTTSQDTPVFDFAAAYKKYPRKMKPGEAEKRFKAVIQSPEDFAALMVAIDRYAADVAQNRTEARYILHMSTFLEDRDSKPYVQHWRDWLDPETGTVSAAPEQIPDWKLKAMAEEERLKNGA